MVRTRRLREALLALVLMSVALAVPTWAVATCAPQAVEGVFQGNWYYRLEIPANFAGTLVIGVNDFEESAPGFAGFLANSVGVQTDVVSAGYAVAVVGPPSAGYTASEKRMYVQSLYELIVRAYCRPAHTVLFGMGAGGTTALHAAEMGEKPFDGAVALCAATRGLTTHADYLLFFNLAFFYSDASWTFGNLAAPSSSIPPSSIGFYLIFNYAAAFTAFVQEVGGFDEFDWTQRVPSNIQEAFSQSLYRLNDINALGGAALASNTIPNTITHTLTTAQILRLDALGLNTIPALTNLNNAFYAGVPPARAVVDGITGVAGNPRVPIISLHATNTALYPPAYATLLQQALAAHGASSKAAFGYFTPTSGSCDISGSQALGALDALRTWITNGSAPASPLSSPGFLPTFVPPAWTFSPV